MTETKQNQAFLDLTAVVWREGDDFVSLCPELGVSSCGSTLEEATSMLKEAVDLYLENARELDMLDAALDGLTSEHRWTTSFRVAV
jgi:predicted RNase H-like HicB family nuclease